MITREQARDQLRAFQIDDWKERRLADAASLPEPLRQIVAALLELDAGYWWTPEHKRRAEARWQALCQVDELVPGARQQVFAALFPRLAPQVEAAWQLLHRLPYQGGEYRRSFRAPHAPEVTRGKRLAWLDTLMRATLSYEPEVSWLAAWAPHVGYGYDRGLGTLFAAAIDAWDDAGQEVFDILLASANGEHPIGMMGRHVTRALLSASRPEGWEFVERLLLAAQRQEGLRQVVLETVDEAHPTAFRRMLRLILEHDLTRFSATLRAAGVWYGFAWEEINPRLVRGVLERALACLEDPARRAGALNEGDPQAAYLALWAQAFEDAPSAVEPSARLLTDPRAERRFVGVHTLAQLGLHPALHALVPALNDDDLQVAGYAFSALRHYHLRLEDGVLSDEVPASPDLFEAFEGLLARSPRERQTPKPLVWPWLTVSVTQTDVAGALSDHLEGQPPTRLLPYLHVMQPHARANVARRLAETKPWDAPVRAMFFELVGDASREVREVALQAMRNQELDEAEARELERLLVRQARDLRRGLIEMLLRQPDPATFASAERLLAGRGAQRLAGLELLEALKNADRLPELCQAVARAYHARQEAVGPEEAMRLERLMSGAAPEAATLDDALGLMDPALRMAPIQPAIKAKVGWAPSRRPRLVTPAAQAVRGSLDALFHTYRDTPVIFETPHGPREALLGQLTYLPRLDDSEDQDGQPAPVPLKDVWERWWEKRPDSERDRDGLELLRALAMPDGRLANAIYREHVPAWLLTIINQAYGQPQSLNYPQLVEAIVRWLLRRHPPTGAADFALDALETTLALVPPEHRVRKSEEDAQIEYGVYYDRDWRASQELLVWLEVTRTCRRFCQAEWTPAHEARLWGLLRWLDEPCVDAPEAEQLPRHYPDFDDVLIAYEASAATEADLLDYLLGPRGGRHGHWYHGFSTLSGISGRKPDPLTERHPYLRDLAARCRERIVDIELRRGDRPTAASAPALSLRWSGGLGTLVRLLAASRIDKLVRGRAWGNLSHDAVFSHLIRASFPDGGDTPEAFRQAVEQAGITAQRLIELALFAPQWARHVEHALTWPALAEGAWWLHAHTKDRRWYVEHELREAWAAEIGEHTPLSAQDLLDGAVDVAWFQRVHAELVGERWQALYSAAQYASGGYGHSRARLFADAMTGRIARADLTRRIQEKRNQDAVRALGLLPLEAGEQRDSDVAERYEVIQAFRHGIRKFGSQRQASEKLAARIGLENLARTAGYADPARLEWALEARAAADLAAGPLTAQVNGVTVSLVVGELGEPRLTVTRGTRKLKAIPAVAKKDPGVSTLVARKRELEQQKSRVRQSLEEAMCRGDIFTADELQSLFGHPVLAPMLSQLVFVGADLLGYPVDAGRSLEDHRGTWHALPPRAQLRIAHPHDLLQTGEWSEWQHECFIHERIQPFKQVFRELYILTTTERDESPLSRRYAGHQVNPRQAMALFTTRGWLAVPGEGVRRTFHVEGLSAWITVLNAAFTPAEVEGLTIEGMVFYRVGELSPMPLAEVPSRVFSEVMRDVDLVVSVAHMGGVDPEASASTVEMRSTLVRETCALLKLDNVRLQNHHVLVDGELGYYSVHLGSAVVHRLPGGALCIVPVHSQHRGRLFLPFADDDPKTAEVLSKVLLLARDREIQDPTVLEQILARG